MRLTKNIVPPFGMDISDNTIKLVQLKAVKDKIKIQAMGKFRLHKGTITNGEIKDEKKITEDIIKAIKSPIFGSINTNEVVACLPDSKTFIKLILIDKGPNKIEQIIESEIEKHVPMNIKEMYFDWQAIDTKNESNLVLAGAAPRSTVNQFVNILKKARLSIAALEIETTAIARTLLAEESPQYNGPYNNNYCLIDIGGRRTSLTVYTKNTIAFSVSLPISGEDVTDKIAEALEIKRSQAEKAKIICGLDKGQAHGIIHDILMNMINNLNNKIVDSLDFYSNHYSEYGPINEIILCGGGANIKNLEQVISESCNIPVKMGNVFTHITNELDKPVKDITQNNNSFPNHKNSQSVVLKTDISMAYSTAIGLALRGFFIKTI